MKRCVYKEGGRRLEQYIDKNTTLEVQKAFALVIFGQCITTDKMGIIEATRVACKFSGFSAEVIRRWATNVFDLFGNVSCVEDVDEDDLVEVLSSKRGCHSKVMSLINDEQFCIKATKYVRQNGYRKGEPNLTLTQFCKWIEEDQNIKVSEQTASTWLRKLGFSYKQFSKGAYFDGNNREDVVEARKNYCTLMEELDPRLITFDRSTPLSNERPIVRIFHDESTFFANADQSFHWADERMQVLKQKSLGQALMVSDFIDEVDGYLRHNGEEAREYLEHQSQGFWKNQHCNISERELFHALRCYC